MEIGTSRFETKMWIQHFFDENEHGVFEPKNSFILEDDKLKTSLADVRLVISG